MGHPPKDISFSVAGSCSQRALSEIPPDPLVGTVLAGLDTHEAVARIPLSTRTLNAYFFPRVTIPHSHRRTICYPGHAARSMLDPDQIIDLLYFPFFHAFRSEMLSEAEWEIQC